MQRVAPKLRNTETQIMERLLRKLCKSITDKEIIGKVVFEFVFYRDGGIGDKPTIYNKIQGDLSSLE